MAKAVGIRLVLTLKFQTIMEQIKQKWNTARKVYGLRDEIATPSGMTVRGRYVLCEAGSCTPSHNPLQMFAKSEGFPTDKNGLSVNDRDYERDTDAQTITRNIAAKYDSRALQSPVVVSQDGIVLSGNGRTMAGMLAARDNTDAAYVGYLREYSAKYGITSLDGFDHPRLVFLTDDDYPYTAETFAAFNAQDIKSQSKTEQAVKLGKLVDDETFHRIIRSINTFDTIGEFYANTRAATDAISDLASVGVISQMSMPEMFDGDTISAQAKEILENVLIGKAFQTNPDAVRQITTYKGMRKNIITALAEISNNIALSDYSLETEMAQAIDLCYCAKDSRYSIADYTRQLNMFDAGTKADVKNPTVRMLADMINADQSTKLKRLFTVYNSRAKDAANGQIDIFSGGTVKTKPEILAEVQEVLGYSARRLDETMQNITNQRKHEARTSIYMEQAERDSKAVQTVKTEVTLGDICRLRLPDGHFMVVKYEYLRGSEAGIRLKGWTRMFVPATLLSPTTETALTLPDWWTADIRCYNDIVRYLSRDQSLLVA